MSTAQPAAPAPVAFASAHRFWVKLGFISFGGPAGQIAIMHRELVERRRWIDEERFLHALNYCMLLPGPEAHQLAIYIGWLLHGVRGGLVAGIWFILPAIGLLLGLSYLYAAYGHLAAVVGVLAGVKPVVVAIVMEAALRIGKRAFRGPADVLIAAGALVAIALLGVPFPLIVLGAALVGLLLVRAAPEAGTAHHSRIPGTVPHRSRTLLVLGLGLLLWVVPLVALLSWRGPGSLHVALYRFFTQAALVTFGGAYAVLAYVTQAAASGYGWITHAQAVDGLALAETTPGPLVMVLQFVGFMAGWNLPEGLDRTASAVVAALITTYVTFMPSFLFIFLGAPYIEMLRGNRHLAGALSAVTAAVVGVIVNLAIVFGRTVFSPEGGGLDPVAVALALGAFVALQRFKADVVWVVIAGGLCGLARVLLAG